MLFYFTADMVNGENRWFCYSCNILSNKSIKQETTKKKIKTLDQTTIATIISKKFFIKITEELEEFYKFLYKKNIVKFVDGNKLQAILIERKNKNFTRSSDIEYLEAFDGFLEDISSYVVIYVTTKDEKIKITIPTGIIEFIDKHKNNKKIQKKYMTFTFAIMIVFFSDFINTYKDYRLLFVLLGYYLYKKNLKYLHLEDCEIKIEEKNKDYSAIYMYFFENKMNLDFNIKISKTTKILKKMIEFIVSIYE